MTGRGRRSTGNISAVKRGPNRLGPSMDRTLRCATPRQVEDTHCGRVVDVSHSPLSVLTSFLQDQDQEPGEDGRTVQRYSLWFRRLFGWGKLWRVPQQPIRACCGTTGLHVCMYCVVYHNIMVGSARIQFNGSLGPHRQSEPSLWVLLRRACRQSQVLTTTGSGCSHAVQQCSGAEKRGRNISWTS
jgi:hypothetical protein